MRCALRRATITTDRGGALNPDVAYGFMSSSAGLPMLTCPLHEVTQQYYTPAGRGSVSGVEEVLLALLDGNGCEQAEDLFGGAVGAERLDSKMLMLAVHTEWLSSLLLIALLCASAGGHIHVVRRLFKVNGGLSDPFGINQCRRSVSKDGCTPLFLACQNDHIDIARFLTEHKFGDVTRPQKDGATPIYIASQKGHLEIVKLLLASIGHSHDTLDKPTNQGLTPLGAATRNGHAEVATVLRAHGATEPSLPFFVIGDHVKVTGLSKGTQYNGRTGTVKSALNTADRLHVELDTVVGGVGGQKDMMLRPVNLVLLSAHPGVGDCTANPPRGALDPTRTGMDSPFAQGFEEFLRERDDSGMGMPGTHQHMQHLMGSYAMGQGTGSPPGCLMQ